MTEAYNQCSAGNEREIIAQALCGADGNGFLQDCTDTQQRAYMIRADAVISVLPQAAPELPAAKEIEALISDFTEPDWDTKTAFASHRRSWIVQCLRAALSLTRPK